MNLLLLIIPIIQAVEFSFYIESEQELCFEDILAINTIAAGTIKAQTSKFQYYIQWERETGYWVELQKHDGEKQMMWNLITENSGVYRFCFYEAGVGNEIYLNYLTGTEANDKSEIATKQDIIEVDSLIDKLQEHIIYIRQQLIVFTSIRYTNQGMMDNLLYYVIGTDIFIFGSILLICSLQIIIIRRVMISRKQQ